MTASPSELRDHRAWCQGDALANVLLLEEVLTRDGELKDGELKHETLVAEARRRASRPVQMAED